MQLTDANLKIFARILTLGTGPHNPDDFLEAKAMVARIFQEDYDSLSVASSYNTYLFSAGICLECLSVIGFHTDLPVDFVMGCGNCTSHGVILKENLLRKNYSGYLVSAAKTYLPEASYRKLHSYVKHYALDKTDEFC